MKCTQKQKLDDDEYSGFLKNLLRYSFMYLLGDLFDYLVVDLVQSWMRHPLFAEYFLQCWIQYVIKQVLQCVLKYLGMGLLLKHFISWLLLSSKCCSLFLKYFIGWVLSCVFHPLSDSLVPSFQSGLISSWMEYFCKHLLHYLFEYFADYSSVKLTFSVI